MKVSGAQRNVLLIGLLPVLAVLVGGGIVTVASIRGKMDYDFGQEYAQPISAVAIVADYQVKVVASPDDKVHVDVTGTYTARQPKTDVKVSESRELTVDARCASSGCGVGLTVAMPGDVPLAVTASGTSLELEGLSGPVTIHADDGSVNGVRLKSEKVSATLRNGSIDLAFVRAPAEVEVNSTYGSIQLLVPAASTYSIDAAAAGGSTTLGVASDPASTRTLKLHAANGSITVGPSH